MSSKRLLALDGVRGLAIVLVLVYHYFYWGVQDQPDTFLHYIRSVFTLGWCGVDLFFVLSGFLIVGILIDQREAKNYYQVFYLRRIYRIFPVYFIVSS